MFVISRDVNALHMLRRAEPDQYPFSLVKAEHRLVVQHVGHGTVWRLLTWNGTGVGVAEITVDA